MDEINYQFEIFKYESEEEAKFNELRTIETKDGKIWFCANDVARMLGYKDMAKAVRTHCKPKGVAEMDTPTNGGVQKTKFITEGNVYRLIIRSQLPTAERFESWIFDEVIPSIREKGYYGKIDRSEEPNFLTRYKANDNRIPRTHFSIISQLYLILNREFEYHGYVIPNKEIDGKEIRPDNSVGRGFVAYLEDFHSELLNEKREYLHKFPNGYEFPANMYPNEMIPIFIDFVYSVWLPLYSATYFKKKDPKALEVLPKVLEEIKEELKIEGKAVSEFTNAIEYKSQKKENIKRKGDISNDDFDKGIDKILGFEIK